MVRKFAHDGANASFSNVTRSIHPTFKHRTTSFGVPTGRRHCWPILAAYIMGTIWSDPSLATLLEWEALFPYEGWSRDWSPLYHGYLGHRDTQALPPQQGGSHCGNTLINYALMPHEGNRHRIKQILFACLTLNLSTSSNGVGGRTSK